MIELILMTMANKHFRFVLSLLTLRRESITICCLFDILKNPSHTRSLPKQINRLDAGKLAFAREQRLKEIQMWSIIQEFVIYAIFIILICLITFSNRDQKSFDQVQHLQRYFFNIRQIDNEYTQVRHSSIMD